MFTCFIGGLYCPEFTASVAQSLCIPFRKADVSLFPNKEMRVFLPSSSIGKHTLVFQSLFPHIHRAFFEFNLLVHAARQGGANFVTGFVPYFPYSRQDRPQVASPLPLEVISKIFQALGLNALLTLAPHSPFFSTFFKVPVISIDPCPQDPGDLLFPWRETCAREDLMLISPDEGGKDRVQRWAQKWNLPWAFCKKMRHQGACRILSLEGEVRHKTVLLIDDMIDTGQTLGQAAALLQQKGARAVYAHSIHGIFSSQAFQLLKDSPLKGLSIFDIQPVLHPFPNLHILNVAPFVTEALRVHLASLPPHEAR